MSDAIGERFRTIQWHYADRDPHALEELEQRIASVGRKRGLVTYSDLVRGVRFEFPSLRDGERTIDVSDWQDVDRAILGDFLGYISLRSYEKARFFSSALVVSKMDGSPGEGFYSLLKELGLISSGRTDKAMYLWAEHVEKAHTWFSELPTQAANR